MEACGTAHHWGRDLEALGHNVAAVALANKLARITWRVWRD